MSLGYGTATCPFLRMLLGLTTIYVVDNFICMQVVLATYDGRSNFLGTQMQPRLLMQIHAPQSIHLEQLSLVHYLNRVLLLIAEFVCC